MATIDAYLNAIKGLESSGRYGVVGPTHPKYGRALGAYQVMESNLPSWSQAALGRRVDPDEYLANPALQDQIAKHRFTGYAEKNGLDNAASMWHSGVPLDQAQARKDSLGTKTPDYVRRVAEAAAKDSGEPVQTAEADLPAEGATETAGPPKAPQSGWEAFMSGGPGALFGAPQKDWNAGDAMLGVGSALMARSNPQGASALAAQINKAKQALNKQVVKTDAKSGEVTTYDQNTGQFTTQKVFSREAPTPKEGDRKFFQQNLDTADAHEDMANTFDKYRRLVAEGKMDFSVLSRAKNSFSEISNENLTEAQRNAVAFGIDMERLRNDKLRAAKGVQTEGDAQRAMNEILPGMTGKFNSDAVLQAMETGYAGAVKGYQRGVRNNEAIVKKYGDDLAYTGYGDAVKGKSSAFEESEKTFTPLRETYKKTRQSKAEETAASGNGRRQVEQPSTGQSLYERHKARVGQ